MDYVNVRYINKKPKLVNPILIEGLPGIGNVGKLAVENVNLSPCGSQVNPSTFTNSTSSPELPLNKDESLDDHLARSIPAFFITLPAGACVESAPHVGRR